MGVKVPEIKYDFWCERDIRGTHGTKSKKYGEKYSGVNAAIEMLNTLKFQPISVTVLQQNVHM